MQIKTSASKFVTMLNKVKCGGIVNDCVIEVTKKGMSSFGASINQEVVFKVALDVEVKEEGQLIVPFIDRFIEILNRFEGMISVVYKDDFVQFKQKGKQAKIRLSSEEKIDSHISAKDKQLKNRVLVTGKTKYKFDECPEVSVDVNSLGSIIKDAGVLGSRKFHFKEKKKSLAVIVSQDSDTIVQAIKAEGVDAGLDSYYENSIADVFSVLSGDKVSLFINSSVGMIIEGEDAGCSFVYLICEAERE